MYKEYKVGGLVYFDGGVQKGVGKIVGKDKQGYYLVNSTQIKNGHNGIWHAMKQDNNNNYFFGASQLSPFTKKVGQRYRYVGIDQDCEIGEILTLIDVEGDDVSLYESDNFRGFLCDLDCDNCESDVQYLDEGEQGFTQQDLEVGMWYEYENGDMGSILNEVQLENAKRANIKYAYKRKENGDLIKIWERSNEELFTLQCPLTNQYLTKFTPDTDNLFWAYSYWDGFTKEETIKIGEHLDWKKVQ